MVRTKHPTMTLVLSEKELALVDWVCKQEGFNIRSQFVRDKILAHCKDYYKDYKQKQELEE